MSALSGVALRGVWCWCMAYTALAPAAVRERRRAELFSHLWESQHAGLADRRVLSAAVRGIGSDVSWLCAVGARRMLRSAVTPTPYVTLAAVVTVVAAFSSAVDSRHQQWSGHVESGGVAVAAVMLIVALLIAVARRRRGR